MIKKLISVTIWCGLTILAFLLAGYMIYVATMLLWTKQADQIESADAIIVLTGSKHRIEDGFKLLLQNKAPTLLISGVTDGVSFQDIVDARDLSTSQKQKILNHCCIELDYVADTTQTNAKESAKWIQDNDIQSIILVTSFSHMPRAILLFNRAVPDSVTIQTYPVRKERRWELFRSFDFWHYAAREYIKYIATLPMIMEETK